MTTERRRILRYILASAVAFTPLELHANSRSRLKERAAITFKPKSQLLVGPDELDPQADIAPVIQHYIDRQSGDHPVEIVIPAGKWLCSGIQLRSGVHLIGDPKASLKMRGKGSSGSLIRVKGSNTDNIINCRIGSLTLDANGSAYCIRADYANNLVVDDCEMFGAHHGVITLLDSSNCRITGNTIGYRSLPLKVVPDKVGVWLMRSSDNLVEYNHIQVQGPTVETLVIGILVDDRSGGPKPYDRSSDRNIIIGNSVTVQPQDNKGIGILIEGGVDTEVQRNNIISNYLGVGVTTDRFSRPESLWTRNTRLIDNTIFGKGEGLIGIQADNYSEFTTIEGGSIQNHRWYGIRIIPNCKNPHSGVEIIDNILFSHNMKMNINYSVCENL